MNRFIRVCVVVLLGSSALLADQANGATKRVDGGRVCAPGDPCIEDGLSWSTAYRSLHAALAAAVPGDQVWIKGGSTPGGMGGPEPLVGYNYDPGADRNATFTVPGGVSLYGHFAGTESAIEERDLVDDDEQFHTIIQGGLSQGASTNNFHVITGVLSAADQTIVFDGLTIRHGTAECTNPASCQASDLRAVGAGVFIQNGLGGPFQPRSSIEFRNCRIRNNSADTLGAGVYVGVCARFVVEDCLFESNSAGSASQTLDVDSVARGGAFFVASVFDTAEMSDGGLYVRRSEFIENSSGNVNRANHGGAISIDNVVANRIVIEDSVFLTNSVGTSGCCGSPLTNCTSTIGQGGAVELRFAGTRQECRIENCIFAGNSVVGRGATSGGALYVFHFAVGAENLHPIELIGNTFAGNTSQQGNGGGAHIIAFNGLNVEHCQFSNNFVSTCVPPEPPSTCSPCQPVPSALCELSVSGGGLYVDLASDGSRLLVAFSTFYSNEAGKLGGGLFIHNSSDSLLLGAIRIINTIFWDNSASELSWQAPCAAASQIDWQNTNCLSIPIQVVFDRCCIQGLSGACSFSETPGLGGNFADDPKINFVPTTVALSLCCDSPCIDRAISVNDIDRRPDVPGLQIMRGNDAFDRTRAIDSPFSPNTTYSCSAGTCSSSFDVGAIEYRPCCSDIDADCVVGLGDVAALIGSWNAKIEPVGFGLDISGDGVVGLADLALVTWQWSCSCVTEACPTTRSCTPQCVP